jgi:mannosyltransferase OCH1-like enzyme
MKKLFKNIERGIARVKQYVKTKSILTKYAQQSIVDSYKDVSVQSDLIGKSSPIWVCWWQGEEMMPEVVKVCYLSIKKHACNHPVVLITSSNQDEYLNIPENVRRKYLEGKISPTHYSDIARMYLLKEYGGIWIDITNFLTQDIDDFIDVNLRYWTCRHITTYNNVSRGLWTSFFSASGKGHLIPSYIYDSLIHWWTENDKVIDYLLMDYIFKIGYDQIPSMKNEIEKVPLQPIGTLRKVLNKKFVEKEWEYYMQEASFHKLSYKKYTDKITKKNEKTHYAYLIERYLS